MENRAWGWIVCGDAAECDNEAITNPEHIQNFINELLEQIEMVPIGETHIIPCDTHDPKKAGLSVYQLLQDSNVSIHFCPEDNNDAYFDVFSCKSYKEETVIELFRKYFKPKAVHSTMLTRRAPR